KAELSNRVTLFFEAFRGPYFPLRAPATRQKRANIMRLALAAIKALLHGSR
ncbi:hypothetical protein M9458_045309, partial [Cirrhinus mrigala]